jgi:hypothetical protein
MKFDPHMSIVFPTIAIIFDLIPKDCVPKHSSPMTMQDLDIFIYIESFNTTTYGYYVIYFLDKFVGTKKNPHHMKINSQHL